MILPFVFVERVINLSKTESAQRSVSRGGNIQIGRRQGFETTVSIQSPPIRHEQVGDLIAFLDDVGVNTPFDVRMPLISQSKGAIQSNLAVKTAASAGSKVIQLKGGPVSTSNLIRPNDMLNFASHSKAYWVGVNMTGNLIDSFDTDPIGDIELRLSQPLLQDVAVDEVVDFMTPNITVIRTSETNELSISASDSNFVTVSFEAVEFI